MPKPDRGRVQPLDQMRSQTAEELEARADRYEQLASQGGGGDDPEWLRRWAARLRQLAKAKQRSRKSKR
ncbi:MAG: hypothetical protein ACK5HA_09230 [Planctomycetaceae bacterium]|jgi:hypothetical protein